MHNRRTFNKTEKQAKINASLKASGFRPIAEIIFVEQGDTMLNCLVIGNFYTGTNMTTKQVIYGLGSSKRNIKDWPDTYVGHSLALDKAVHNFVAQQRALGVKYIPRGKRVKEDLNLISVITPEDTSHIPDTDIPNDFTTEKINPIPDPEHVAGFGDLKILEEDLQAEGMRRISEEEFPI